MGGFGKKNIEGQTLGLLEAVSDQELHLVIIDVAIHSSFLQISDDAVHI